MNRLRPSHIALASVLAVFAIAMIPQVFSDRPGARRVRGAVVTEVVGTAQTNATVAYQVKLVEGSDAEHEADHMFQALAGLPGIGKVSLDTRSLQLTVAYDDASGDTAAIRERLLGSGYLSPTRDDATPTKVAGDGSVQRLAIADTGNSFEPYLILAKADVPIELDFAPGTKCRVVVKFPQVGVEQDIAKGGKVNLPSLKPGEYRIACGEGGHEGTLIVE